LREELYDRVRDIISRQEFEARVKEEVEVWGGLLEEDAAALLVIDQLGRNEVTFRKVADLYEGGEAFLRVRVESISPVRGFERRDGAQGRVVNLVVRDDTGRCRVVLWDDEVDLVTSGKLAVGSSLKVVDGYVRRGRYGLEVTSGKWGVILPEES
jgi:replication factor A1